MASDPKSKRRKEAPPRASDEARRMNFMRQTGLDAKQPGSAAARRLADKKRAR